MRLPQIPPLATELEPAVRAALDGKAKPPGALGRIEALALQLALITGQEEPRIERTRLMVFAGDHGLTRSGVSAYPASVTPAMVATLLAGRASAIAFAEAVGAEVIVVDAGVDAELPSHPRLISAKVRRGSADAACEAAMTAAEAETAVERGAALAIGAVEAGVDLLALGEMGIGNSASAALLMHRLAPAPLEDCVGAGAGHDAAGMARKRAALATAAARTAVTAPLAVLAEFGGLEIAMMAGAAIGAASRRRPVLVDGFIASAAALAAWRLAPEIAGYLLFSHRSAEKGHARLLQAMGADPLLDLDLRLGEGTGALLAAPLVRAAARLLTDVASLEDVLDGRL